MTAWRSLAGLLALCACAHVTPACAADAATDVDVSRVTLKLPGAGWTVSGKFSHGVGVNSAALTVDGERRLATIGGQFAGPDAQPAVSHLPEGMPANLAAWADKLAEEALGTLSSWSGRLAVPPVAFTPPVPSAPALKTALAAPAAIED